MKRTIQSTELKIAVGEYVNAVHFRGGTYVISQRGKEVAASVPIQILEDDEPRRARLTSALDRLRDEAKQTDPEAIANVLERAIADARAEKRGRKRKGAAKRNGGR